MSEQPNGIPAVTYVRILNESVQGNMGTDIIADGSAVTILEPGMPQARFDGFILVEKNASDQEVILHLRYFPVHFEFLVSTTFILILGL